jgi:hypothetical protein
MKREYQFQFTASVMVRKNIRQMLESEHFGGRDIRWMENKGWLESAFHVRGEFSDAKAVESRVLAYIERLNAA